jgi:hypothetical protein
MVDMILTIAATSTVIQMSPPLHRSTAIANCHALDRVLIARLLKKIMGRYQQKHPASPYPSNLEQKLICRHTGHSVRRLSAKPDWPK